MKTYIFYSNDGFTQDNSSSDTENCQVLGWGSGESAEQAFENLKNEISVEGFEDICCQELKSEHIFICSTPNYEYNNQRT